MGLGYAVRSRLGKYEPAVSEAYRARFIDLADLATTVATLAPNASRIAEIGCGDGSMAMAMLAKMPRVTYTGIDLAPTPGRLFEGDRSRVQFHCQPSADLVATDAGQFDVVLVVDVVHHVADDQRVALLADAAALVRPGGLLAFKDWEMGRGLAHLLAYGSDRYISGDTTVRFMPYDELRSLAAQAAPDFELVVECRVPPRRNNVLLALRKPA
ncbi:methyltransferase [Modestobacter sp. I12A-02628]|uniref:Methyltransferase n=1 Tax=Goekera deserti TaxID=2497753 RepID=A0A7K3W7Y5_9ACTN|nr:methyltransferase [Goekera deserti]MPQ99784.1 methyltransferase [Goekera deserti]NDI49940.1 methyltransferase [Goekera deserti]NEL52582.1 methyltransferase [Goekera deserti]